MLTALLEAMLEDGKDTRTESPFKTICMWSVLEVFYISFGTYLT